MNFDSGLRETVNYKVLKIKQIEDGDHKKIEIIYLCKKDLHGYKIAKVRYYDKDGMPCWTSHRTITCHDVDDVEYFYFYISGKDYGLCETYNNYEFIWIDLWNEK